LSYNLLFCIVNAETNALDLLWHHFLLILAKMSRDFFRNRTAPLPKMAYRYALLLRTGGNIISEILIVLCFLMNTITRVAELVPLQEGYSHEKQRLIFTQIYPTVVGQLESLTFINNIR
jgi:hypothetical protein